MINTDTNKQEVAVTGDYLKETPKAICFDCYVRGLSLTVWVPKSQITKLTKAQVDEDGVIKSSFCVPRWLATKNSLDFKKVAEETLDSSESDLYSEQSLEDQLEEDEDEEFPPF